MYDRGYGLLASRYVTISSIDGKGRHIICGTSIRKGKVIGRIPIIVVPQEEVKLLRQTQLFNYVFEWDPEERYKTSKDLVQCDQRYNQGVALGLISLCNHSHTPNSDYEFDYEEDYLVWRAIRDIEQGEEVTIHYKVPLWFQMYDEADLAAQ